MNMELLEQQLSELPLYIYDFFDPRDLEFSSRIRWIWDNECPMYGKTWACPPGVGTVDGCRSKGLSFENCLLISSIVEVRDIADMDETLATRPDHEAMTNEVAAIIEEIRKYVPKMKENGGYIFSSDHSIPNSVSLENMKIIIDAAKRIGSY